MKIYTIIYISFFLLIPVYASGSDDIWFHNLSVADGLSENNVECLLQDSLGIIWIGTRDGLNSYDGYTFTKYKHLIGPNALKKKFISALYLDMEGNIWIGTISEGISVYNYKKREFFSISGSDEFPVDFNELTIWDIKGDDKGNIWIASQKGLYQYSLNQSRIVKALFCGECENKKELIIRCLSFDNENQLWIGTESEGLKIYNRLTNSVLELKRNPTDKNSLSSNFIKSLYFEDDSILWIGTMDRGLNRLNTNTYINQRINISDDKSSNNITINKILRDRKNELWICTENYGLKLYNDDNQVVTTFQKQEFLLHGISNNTITDIIEDRTGLLWIGLRFSGLDRFYPKSLGFSLYQHIPNDQLSLSNNNIRAFCEDASGNIWMGTDGGGIDLFDKGLNKIKALNKANAPFHFDSNVAMSIISDRKGNIWIATWGDGLIRYDPTSGKYQQYITIPGNRNTLSSNFLVNLYCDDSNNIWISCFGEGPVVFMDKKQEFVRLDDEQLLNSDTEVYYIMKIFEDSEDNIWFATGGSGIVVKKGNFYYTLRHDSNNSTSLSSNFVYSVFEDSKKRVWIGTGEKLNLFDSKSKQFYHFGVKEGFINESIYDIQEDERGYLWLSTNAGVIRFNPDSNTVHNFDNKYHLQANQFNANAGIKLENGTILFGGIGGFNAFNPEEITLIENRPYVVIKDFLLFNEIQFPGKQGSPLNENISYTDRVSLNHKQAIFTI